MRLYRRGASLFALCLSVAAGVSFGQDALVLASGTAGSAGTVSLSLALTSVAGSEPASLQWSFTYPVASVTSISASVGDSANAAGKSLACTGSPGVYTCLLAGLNTNIIADGTVAVVNLTIAPGRREPLAVGLGGGWASLPSGFAVSLTAAGGIIAGGGALPAVSSFSCAPASLISLGSSTCTVALSGAAPSGGASVHISGAPLGLTVPASVTVPAGATSTTFTASAGIISLNLGVTLTAAYNGSSVNALLNLVTPVQASSLACNPTSLGQNVLGAPAR